MKITAPVLVVRHSADNCEGLAHSTGHFFKVQGPGWEDRVRVEVARLGVEAVAMILDRDFFRLSPMSHDSQEKVGVPIIGVYTDIVRQGVRSYFYLANKWFARNVVLDRPFPGASWHASPIQPAYYRPKPPLQRDIPVLFVGSLNETRRGLFRKAAVRGAEIKVVERGLSYQEYADLLCRAKVVINHALNLGRGRAQLKGRIFEAALAGAAVTELSNKFTSELLPPEAICSYGSTNELVATLSYLLEGDNWLRHADYLSKAAEGYSAAAVWGRILEELRT